MAKMTLKVKVNDLHFQYHLRVSHDACLAQIWWFQLKSVTSYHANKVKFTDGRTDAGNDNTPSAWKATFFMHLHVTINWIIILSFRRQWVNTASSETHPACTLIAYQCHWSPAVNSLRPSDATWRHSSGSTLAQVMACCLTAPSHYLNQCWLIISKV